MRIHLSCTLVTFSLLRLTVHIVPHPVKTMSTTIAACRKRVLVYARLARSPVSSPFTSHLKRLHSTRWAPATAVSTLRIHSGRSAPSLLSSSVYSLKRLATSTTPHSTAVDPAETEALLCLEKGTQKLEEGDVEGAKSYYQRSVNIKRDAGSLFNLGVTHYHLNLASAYIISPVSRPDLALHHLRIASSLAPEDPEIAFNIAAVLEACGKLEESLTHYKRSKEYGVERAEMHIRNVSAKIIGQRMEQAADGTDPK
ncbi:hypothetical protein EW145_g5271 [Phellinidium pouzarii]|uniref:MalT-like TPR region domain-containing protein n=1 Tax=Phellinidium pouzarii TaxID=167371 RepID=A0A4V3XC75_9AGAM|nr:hypothetical protein EW145_g5271 [Phellinidium pouzarii]